MTIRYFHDLFLTYKGLLRLGKIALVAACHGLFIGWLSAQVSGTAYAYEVIVAVTLTVWLLTTAFIWRRCSRNDAVISAVAGGYIVLLQVVMYSRLLP